MADSETRVPTPTCPPVVRGSVTPAALYAACVSPEQSQEFGPVAPHTYGSPSWAWAKAMALSATDAFAGVVVEVDDVDEDVEAAAFFAAAAAAAAPPSPCAP